MAFYDKIFDMLGWREWCDADKTGESLSMADLMAKAKGGDAGGAWYEIPFPSLDNLHKACDALARTSDMTTGVEQFFLDIKGGLKFVLDPITQPLSWLLDGSLSFFGATPWWVLIPAILVACFYASRNAAVTLFVGLCFMFLAFIDHYSFAVETLSIIFVCTVLSIVLGVPIGIAMSKNDLYRRINIPILDMLQTLPSFVYLIPLIFLFSVTESKLYGIAIIMYAIVPVIRLTDLGIRLVDKDVIEAANAFGMTSRQKLFGVEIPLALPNIMAGVNQTIMMALAMVVIASLVSAPGLGTLVLRGIRNLELGVGLVSGFCIVLLAIILDRVSKASLARIDTSQSQ
jgi:glycine betaine/proline transport system permease protein